MRVTRLRSLPRNAMLAAVRRPLLALFVSLLVCSAEAQESLQFSGFVLLRAASAPDDGPLQSEALSAQAQVGIEWFPTPMYGARVHLAGRTEDAEARRGNAGIVEAYAEANFVPLGDRLRLRAGALFLPTSRENVDALWEPAYTITSSALNTWFGEEFRPIGVDASYFRGRGSIGATVYRGNDTFGALPPVRGWKMGDHWITLGEWIPVDDDYFTSVSAETDGNLGWSARGAWYGERVLVQFTHIDNRSDGLRYGRLFNWNTKFDIAAVEYSHDVWTVAAEYGWGPTFLVVGGNRYTDDLAAGYLLVSRWWPRGRATVRADLFGVDRERDTAVTVAWLWTPPGRLRPGFEFSASEGERRALIELRYSFSR